MGPCQILELGYSLLLHALFGLGRRKFSLHYNKKLFHDQTKLDLSVGKISLAFLKETFALLELELEI